MENKTQKPLSSHFVKIIRVIDGDTYTCEDTETGQTLNIRISGVDSPEKSQTTGQLVTNSVKSLIEGQYMRCDILEQDHYGRNIAQMFLLKNNKKFDLSKVLIQRGLALAYNNEPDDPYYIFQKKLITEMRHGITPRYGIWAIDGYLEERNESPAEYRNRIEQNPDDDKRTLFKNKTIGSNTFIIRSKPLKKAKEFDLLNKLVIEYNNNLIQKEKSVIERSQNIKSSVLFLVDKNNSQEINSISNNEDNKSEKYNESHDSLLPQDNIQFEQNIPNYDLSNSYDYIETPLYDDTIVDLGEYNYNEEIDESKKVNNDYFFDDYSNNFEEEPDYFNDPEVQELLNNDDLFEDVNTNNVIEKSHNVELDEEPLEIIEHQPKKPVTDDNGSIILQEGDDILDYFTEDDIKYLFSDIEENPMSIAEYKAKKAAREKKKKSNLKP